MNEQKFILHSIGREITIHRETFLSRKHTVYCQKAHWLFFATSILMKNDSTQGRKVMLVSVVITGLLISAYATLFAAGMSRSSIGGVFKDFAISPTTFLPWFISLVSIVAPAWWLGAWAGRIAADHGRLWALAASTAVTMACLLSLSFTIALMQPVLVTSKISTFLGRCEDAALTGLVSLFFGAVPALVTGLVSGCFLPRRTVSRS